MKHNEGNSLGSTEFRDAEKAKIKGYLADCGDPEKPGRIDPERLDRTIRNMIILLLRGPRAEQENYLKTVIFKAIDEFFAEESGYKPEGEAIARRDERAIYVKNTLGCELAFYSSRASGSKHELPGIIDMKVGSRRWVNFLGNGGLVEKILRTSIDLSFKRDNMLWGAYRAVGIVLRFSGAERHAVAKRVLQIARNIFDTHFQGVKDGWKLYKAGLAKREYFELEQRDHYQAFVEAFDIVLARNIDPPENETPDDSVIGDMRDSTRHDVDASAA